MTMAPPVDVPRALQDLSLDARQILQRYFGYDHFRAEQAAIIQHVAAGGNALVLMPTGGGKSLCYQIPALLRPGVSLVISPLIALMQDQVNALQQRGIPAAYLNSTLKTATVRELYLALQQQRLKLLYIAPERLVQPGLLSLLDRLYAQQGLGLFAIDEAHCIAQWGHDFRPEYRQLVLLHQRYAPIPRIALTATADQQTRQEILGQLQLESARQFISSFDRPNLRYAIVEKHHPGAQIQWFLQHRHRDHAGIIYCQSRRQVEQSAQWLSQRGWSVLPYHAGLEAPIREANQQRFLSGSVQIMVATIAFGMGVDKADVRFVIHLECPRSLEGYYQETGRAGRDGDWAEVLLLYHPQDLQRQYTRLRQWTQDRQRQACEAAKLQAMAQFCRTTHCRRAQLLAYFGESAAPVCSGCDRCNPDYLSWVGPQRRHHPVVAALQRTLEESS